MAEKLLLVDVDCGVDDAQAIMMALAQPTVQILGITCCHGNTAIDNVCKNVLRVLKLCNESKIPVYRGAASSFLGENVGMADYHGSDGLGGVPDPEAPALDCIQEEHAVTAMIRIVSEHIGKVSLVATGPLTNLALAVKMDPTFPQKLKGLYIMGGNMESRGNTSVCGEFNFSVDPEAAYIVLNEYSCPTYIATWEYTCRHKLSWEFYNDLVNQDTAKAKFMKKISAHSLKFSQSEQGIKELVSGSGFVPCDSFAMAAAVDNSIVKEYIECGVSVELSGKLCRGMMIMDYLDLLQKKHKAFVMKTCDIEKFKTLLRTALK
ncbi:inosine-uridine preferring nucleoside hydrolase-like [Protopterus annectens]|uniref:inosine-uridine preferring nucleoside hydrolase-like n=1 Tax=Protopterus annectens TaxID=7888 RepID=UPI001CFBDADB|nr:inosine-uridine preferring nucleoside hydrolase-like [Protopterus annectens]XP_043928102.1 inosine-uridine preferring nucleoside hydrolase-like [Protopterus annectens]